MANRRELSEEAKMLRNALYADGRRPTTDEKAAVQRQIVLIPGCQWYETRHHSNWCTDKERDLAKRLLAQIGARLQANPNPTLLDIKLWGIQLGYPGKQVAVATIRADELRTYGGGQGAATTTQNDLDSVFADIFAEFGVAT